MMDWIDANGQSATADDLEEKLSGVLLVPDTRCRFTHFIAEVQAIVNPITLNCTPGVLAHNHMDLERKRKSLTEADRTMSYRGCYEFLPCSIYGRPVRLMIKIVATRSYNICVVLFLLIVGCRIKCLCQPLST
jgi:hypothetical protein